MTESRSSWRWTGLSTLRILLLLKPAPIDPRRVGPGQVLIGVLGLMAALAVIDALSAATPRAFEIWGLLALLGVPAVLALAAAVMARISGRPLLWPAIMAVLCLTLGAQLLLLHAVDAVWSLDARVLLTAGAAWLVLSLRRLLDGLDPRSRTWRRGTAALVGAAMVLGVMLGLPRVPVVDTAWEWTPEHDDPIWPAFDAETLFLEQPARVEAALAALAPQTPGVADMYVLALGSDGSERVFVQEADYAARLLAQRFGAEGRTLVLGNDLRAPEARPLASLSNLRQALRGIASIMDPDEDILFLFVTTHGSEDHRLLVHLPPLPLNAITPDDLRDALDASGIRWRVVLVSACYSGGFIDALANATSLVMTAARADRTSFGCGPGSDITWFGRAFFAEALNQTDDLVMAFDIARDLIAQWEQADDMEASHPQIRSTPLIESRLRVWSAAFTPGAPLAFEAPGDEGTGARPASTMTEERTP